MCRPAAWRGVNPSSASLLRRWTSHPVPSASKPMAIQARAAIFEQPISIKLRLRRRICPIKNGGRSIQLYRITNRFRALSNTSKGCARFSQFEIQLSSQRQTSNPAEILENRHWQEGCELWCEQLHKFCYTRL